MQEKSDFLHRESSIINKTSIHPYIQHKTHQQYTIPNYLCKTCYGQDHALQERRPQGRAQVQRSTQHALRQLNARFQVRFINDI